MPLNKINLQNAIKAAFKKAKDTTPPPASAEEAELLQEKILTDLALDLANAVDAFTRSGDVVQVKVEVKDINTSAVIGTGTQTDVGKIQ